MSSHFPEKKKSPFHDSAAVSRGLPYAHNETHMRAYARLGRSYLATEPRRLITRNQIAAINSGPRLHYLIQFIHLISPRDPSQVSQRNSPGGEYLGRIILWFSQAHMREREKDFSRPNEPKRTMFIARWRPAGAIASRGARSRCFADFKKDKVTPTASNWHAIN